MHGHSHWNLPKLLLFWRTVCAVRTLQASAFVGLQGNTPEISCRSLNGYVCATLSLPAKPKVPNVGYAVGIAISPAGRNAGKDGNTIPTVL
jgi:hypothetical protein